MNRLTLFFLGSIFVEVITGALAAKCPAVDPPTPIYFPHEYDCNKFYMCSNGYQILHKCPPNLNFNEELHTCDWPNVTKCSNNTSNEVSTKAPIVSNGTQNEINSCPSVDDNPAIDILIPHESDCSKFYKCSHGQKIIQNCAHGLFYDVKMKRCDWPDKVNCYRNNSNEVITQTAPPGNQSVIQTVPPANQSVTEATPPANQSVTQTVPSANQSVTEVTPAANQSVTETVPSANQSVTEATPAANQSVTQTVPLTNQNVTEATPPANQSVTQTVPPTNQSVTEGGPPTNQSVTEATPPANQSVTEATPAANQSVTQAVPPTNQSVIECPLVEKDPNYDILLPHESNCSMFYKCSFGQKIVQNCPYGLFYDVKTRRCDWPDRVNCYRNNTNEVVTAITPPANQSVTQATPPTNQSVTQAVPSANQSVSECPLVEKDPNYDILLPHESNCSMFYKCSFGQKILQNCPYGLFYDVKTRRCDWPDRVNCYRNNTNEVVTQTAPSGNQSVIQTVPPANQSVTEATPAANQSVTQTTPPANQSVTEATPPVNQSVTQTVPSANQSVTEATPAANQSVTQTTPPANQSVTEGRPPTNQSVTEATPTANQSVTQTTPSANQSVTEGGPPTNQSVTEATPTANQSVTQTVPSANQSVTEATPAANQNVTQTTPPTNQSVTEGGPPTNQSVTEATPSANNSVSVCPSVEEDPDNDILLPHEYDCSKFYKCSHGQKVEQNCPDGLHYNPRFNICDLPENVKCSAATGFFLPRQSRKVSSVNQQTKDVRKTTKQANYNNYVRSHECPLVEEDPEIDILLPHEQDCTKFYKCSRGQKVEQNCPSGLFFNFVLKYCDWPWNVECIVDVPTRR